MASPEGINRRGQAITVTVGIQLVITFGCLVVRLYMRWPWRKIFSRADGLAVAGMVSRAELIQDQDRQEIPS